MRTQAELSRRSLRRPVLLTVGLVCLTAAMIGFGAFATFTDSQSVEQTVSTGTVELDPLEPPSSTNRLSVGASNIAAGDTIQRSVLLRQGGTIELSEITLTTTADPSSLLDTDTDDGLQMVIERCSESWAESGPPYTYTCGGDVDVVLASQPVIGSSMALANLVLDAEADNFLRVTLTLPSSAPNALQDQSSTIDYVFSAVQRTGTAQ